MLGINPSREFLNYFRFRSRGLYCGRTFDECGHFVSEVGDRDIGEEREGYVDRDFRNANGHTFSPFSI